MSAIPLPVTLAPQFPVPVFPVEGKHIAYRPSWFALQLRGAVTEDQMLALLGNLNQERLARLPDRTIRSIYLALLEEMGERFPILDHIQWQIENEWDDEEMMWVVSNIPVEVMGLDPWNNELRAPLFICFVLSNPAEYASLPIHHDLTKQVRRWLEPMIAEALQRETKPYTNPIVIPKPPRGRQWRKEWAALSDMLRYSTSQTGYAILDYDQNGLDENGWDSYPPLNLDEIRGLERGWKVAKPILDRIFVLVDFIERAPDTRLELLARVLLGDKDALEHVTEAKPHVATLAQIFTKARR